MGLQNFQGFVGIADVTLSSTLKIYISSILTNGFIQYHDIILQPSSDQDDFLMLKTIINLVMTLSLMDLRFAVYTQIYLRHF